MIFGIKSKKEKELEAKAKALAEEENINSEEYSKVMLDALISLVESRNVESGSHIVRVRNIVSIMLSYLEDHRPEYGITPKMVNLYSEAATLHDIGKIAIPDNILNKPGKLTEEEFEVMKTHPAEGAKIVDNFVLPGQEELLQACKDVVLHHHERFDGQGYPEGLVGDENNICVQVMGVADCYDALVSKRCYKESYSHEKAIEMIVGGECGEFNPVVLEAFINSKDRIRAVYAKE